MNIKVNFKEEGITLVTLVITIIIMLILAGVTLGNVLGDNGLIAKAKSATAKYKDSELDEQRQLEELLKQLDINNVNIENADDNTKRELLKKLEELEKKKSVKYYEFSDGQKVAIPKGFYYVGGTIENGVVISDNQEDEEKYKDSEKVPSGADESAYDQDGKVDESKLSIKGNQFVWIPCEVSDYKKIDFEKTNSLSWEKNTNSSELQQIIKYKGFYIGRFEAGTSKIKLNNATFGSAEQSTTWNSEKYTSDKVTEGTITERPRRDTMVSCKLSNSN